MEVDRAELEASQVLINAENLGGDCGENSSYMRGLEWIWFETDLTSTSMVSIQSHLRMYIQAVLRLRWLQNTGFKKGFWMITSFW